MPIADPVPTTTIERYGKEEQVIEVVRIRPYILDKTKQSVTFWLGEWGVEGKGHFCTKNCGWRWAVLRCNADRGQQRTAASEYKEHRDATNDG